MEWPATPAREGPATPARSTKVRAGNGLVARAGRPFGAQLSVVVTGPAGPLPGVSVTFRVVSGVAAFAGGARVATASSGPDGVACSPVLDAGGVIGAVRVTALAAGGMLPASFDLRVVVP